MKISRATLGSWLALLSASEATCPFFNQQKNENFIQNVHRKLDTQSRTGDGGIPDGGFAAVRQDIEEALTNSKDFFPADFGNYAGLMIRLAWHCNGSYRDSDGRGGCDGGRIRFDPELNWEDNATLNMALRLLEPIKEKYGSKLSWGDLIVLAGDTAISSTGGPILGFCGGRIDDPDGSDSLKLGPSPEQEEIAPCISIDRQGLCQSPLGPTTVGLIYVNPAGPVNAPGNTTASGLDIRNAFTRMGMNDSETVALTGGGHAYGKTHGACPTPPCGDGIGPNTFTSGFEGPWTTTPTIWSNQYFQNMFNYNWELITGPGGNIQWAPNTTDGSVAPDIMMLTADLALRDDPEYNSLSKLYSEDIASLEHDFMHAWYKLVTSDMGPVSRCIGDEVPPAQPHQRPLPDGPEELPDFIAVRSSIQELIDSDEANVEAFVNLAYRCASTYRNTDYKGGCNGARIRFPPESEWESNAGTAEALNVLQTVKDTHADVSYADLIVLAGQTAIESAGGTAMHFCGGRVDADHADGSDILAPRQYTPAVVSIRDDMQVKGLTAREGVALAGRPTSSSLSNQFYIDLLAGEGEFSAEEQALLEDEFKAIVEEYAADNDVFMTEFANAWTKLMIADRFAGPFDNACTGVQHATLEGEVDVVAEETEEDGGDDEDEAADESAAWTLFATPLFVSVAASLVTLSIS